MIVLYYTPVIKASTATSLPRTPCIWSWPRDAWSLLSPIDWKSWNAWWMASKPPFRIPDSPSFLEVWKHLDTKKNVDKKKQKKKTQKVGKHIQIFQVQPKPPTPSGSGLIASLESLVPSGSAGHPAWIIWRICWGFFWEKMLGHILGGKLKRCKKNDSKWFQAHVLRRGVWRRSVQVVLWWIVFRFLLGGCSFLSQSYS